MAKKKDAKQAATRAAVTLKTAEGRPKTPKDYLPRLKKRYQDQTVSRLREEFGIENAMAVPRLEKISVNNYKLLEAAQVELAAIAGQHATITRARRSIAAFKLREGMAIGCRVTLRGNRMWDFLDRLIATALPRVRDFRGVSNKSFDGRGNYTLGIREHVIFPEVDTNRVEGNRGLNVTIVTSSGNDERARFLLRDLGMPFARQAGS
jgi:large subunit ribosomal protein L5